jgi:hypothetical protein
MHEEPCRRPDVPLDEWAQENILDLMIWVAMRTGDILRDLRSRSSADRTG